MTTMTRDPAKRCAQCAWWTPKDASKVRDFHPRDGYCNHDMPTDFSIDEDAFCSRWTARDGHPDFVPGEEGPPTG